MRKILTASVAALALSATALGAAAPAEAQRWHGGYRGHYGGGGWALGAGLLGLAAGAAIASDRHYYGYGYAPGYYGYAPAYYAPPPPYYYGARGYCRSDWRWDGWAHRYVRVRYCD
jgi:hypothetical protein